MLQHPFYFFLYACISLRNTDLPSLKLSNKTNFNVYAFVDQFHTVFEAVTTIILNFSTPNWTESTLI